MSFYLAPGVYSKEKDLSNIIPNIATTTAGLVGASARGDVDNLVLCTTPQQYLTEFGNPTPGNYFHYTALAYLENGNKLYCKRVVNGALYGGVKIMQSGFGPNAAISAGSATKTFQDVSGETILFEIYGKDPGAWNNSIGVRVINVNVVDYTFDIEVYSMDADGNYEKVETWTVSRKQQVDGYGRQQYLEDVINGYSAYIAVADNLLIADTGVPVTQSTTLALAEGNDGSAVSASDVSTGWDAFTNPYDVDVRLLLNGGFTDVIVQQKMKTIVEARKDCIAILDMPYAQLTSVTSMVNWRTVTQNFNSSYTALYAPWMTINDQWNGKVIQVPPSGYIASMMAYNDYVAEPWYAPAGFNRGLLNVLGIYFGNGAKSFSQGELETLYQNGINPCQVFRGEGNAIWGQKTQQSKASALDRINVRRLLIVLEKSISAALRYFVFENNDERTRLRITAMVEEYMTLLAARGAFQAEEGDRGFRVVCDTTNNTPAIIDRNELHVDIFIKPIRSAEFIQLQTIITSSGASFQELLVKGFNF